LFVFYVFESHHLSACSHSDHDVFFHAELASDFFTNHILMSLQRYEHHDHREHDEHREDKSQEWRTFAHARSVSANLQAFHHIVLKPGKYRLVFTLTWYISIPHVRSSALDLAQAGKHDEHVYVPGAAVESSTIHCAAFDFTVRMEARNSELAEQLEEQHHADEESDEEGSNTDVATSHTNSTSTDDDDDDEEHDDWNMHDSPAVLRHHFEHPVVSLHQHHHCRAQLPHLHTEEVEQFPTTLNSIRFLDNPHPDGSGPLAQMHHRARVLLSHHHFITAVDAHRSKFETIAPKHNPQAQPTTGGPGRRLLNVEYVVQKQTGMPAGTTIHATYQGADHHSQTTVGTDVRKVDTNGHDKPFVHVPGSQMPQVNSIHAPNPFSADDHHESHDDHHDSHYDDHHDEEHRNQHDEHHDEHDHQRHNSTSDEDHSRQRDPNHIRIRRGRVHPSVYHTRLTPHYRSIFRFYMDLGDLHDDSQLAARLLLLPKDPACLAYQTLRTSGGLVYFRHAGSTTTTASEHFHLPEQCEPEVIDISHGIESEFPGRERGSDEQRSILFSAILEAGSLYEIEVSYLPGEHAGHRCETAPMEIVVQPLRFMSEETEYFQCPASGSDRMPAFSLRSHYHRHAKEGKPANLLIRKSFFYSSERREERLHLQQLRGAYRSERIVFRSPVPFRFYSEIGFDLVAGLMGMRLVKVPSTVYFDRNYVKSVGHTVKRVAGRMHVGHPTSHTGTYVHTRVDDEAEFVLTGRVASNKYVIAHDMLPAGSYHLEIFEHRAPDDQMYFCHFFSLLFTMQPIPMVDLSTFGIEFAPGAQEKYIPLALQPVALREISHYPALPTSLLTVQHLRHKVCARCVAA
jgi:hypothetical protein